MIHRDENDYSWTSQRQCYAKEAMRKQNTGNDFIYKVQKYSALSYRGRSQGAGYLGRRGGDRGLWGSRGGLLGCWQCPNPRSGWWLHRLCSVITELDIYLLCTFLCNYTSIKIFKSNTVLLEKLWKLQKRRKSFTYNLVQPKVRTFKQFD